MGLFKQKTPGGGKLGILHTNYTEEMAAIVIQRWFLRRLQAQQAMDQAMNEDKSAVLNHSQDLRFNIKKQQMKSQGQITRPLEQSHKASLIYPHIEQNKVIL